MGFADDGISWWLYRCTSNQDEIGRNLFSVFTYVYSEREKSECNETWLIVAADCFFHIVYLKHKDIMCILTEVDIHIKSDQHIETQTFYMCVTRAYMCERPVYMCLYT